MLAPTFLETWLTNVGFLDLCTTIKGLDDQGLLLSVLDAVNEVGGHPLDAYDLVTL